MPLACEARAGHDLYAYVLDNPLNLIDPSGLQGVGVEACTYYDEVCGRSRGNTSKSGGSEDSYACQAGTCCRDFGNQPTINKVRECLLDADKQCGLLPESQRKQCRRDAHFNCYTKFVCISCFREFPSSCWGLLRQLQ